MKIAGKLVRNAKKPVTLIITSNDVKKGAAKDPGACAAALACMRQLGATEARVHVGRTYIKIEDEWMRYNTPVALQKEIVAFDRGGLLSRESTPLSHCPFRISIVLVKGRAP